MLQLSTASIVCRAYDLEVDAPSFPLEIEVWTISASNVGFDRIHKAKTLVKTPAAGPSRCLHGNQCFTENHRAPVSFIRLSRLPIHATWLTPGPAGGFTDVPRPGMWVKGHSAGYRWERPFWGNGISSCGEACTSPITRLRRLNKAIRRRRVPAQPQRDTRLCGNTLLV